MIDIKILKLNDLQLIMDRDILTFISAGKLYNSQIDILYNKQTQVIRIQYNVMANRIAWINSVYVCPSLLNVGHLNDSSKIKNIFQLKLKRWLAENSDTQIQTI